MNGCNAYQAFIVCFFLSPNVKYFTTANFLYSINVVIVGHVRDIETV